MRHLPPSALPGGAALLLDPAAATLAAHSFAPRRAVQFAPQPEFESGFVAPAFTNGWSNYGAGYEVAGYYKDRSGIVHLRGLIKSGVIGAAAFTLPVGARPGAQEIFSVVANDAFGRVDVLSTGVVQVAVGSNAFVSLAGITFRAV